MINEVMETEKETINIENISTNQLDILETSNDKSYPLILPYAGPKGNNMIKSMNNDMQRFIPNNVKTRIAYTGREVGTKFQIKDLTKNQHEHDLIYYDKSPEANCKLLTKIIIETSTRGRYQMLYTLSSTDHR